MTALKRSFFSALRGTGLLLLLMTVVAVSGLRAQMPVAVGAGSGSNDNTGFPCPLQDYFEGSRMQFIYHAEELKAAGMDSGFINALAFKVVGNLAVSSVAAVEQLTIKIGGTAGNELDINSWVTGMVQVYGPVDYKAVKGLNTFVFSSPFLWNGHDNLVIEVCNGGEENKTEEMAAFFNPGVVFTNGLPFNASHTYLADGSGSLCNTDQTMNTGATDTRPDIVFDWTPAITCAGMPVGGNALTSASSVCINQPFELSLEGHTVAAGITCQWQSSADQLTWTNVPGATTFKYTATQTGARWYRALLTCAISGMQAYATTVYVYSAPLVTGVFSINKDAPAGGGNFQSFNDAYNFIKCGISGSVVFNVTSVSGEYNEQLMMKAIPGASAASTVTFNGNGQKIIYTSSDYFQRDVVKLDGASHIRFNNLVIQAGGSGFGGYGWAVHLMNNADSNSVSNCTILVDSTTGSDNYAGIVINASDNNLFSFDVSGCDSNTFHNNTISGGLAGIAVTSNTQVSNARNSFTENRVREFFQYGLYISGSFATRCHHNYFARPARTEQPFDIYGIYATDINASLLINANTITGLAGSSSFLGTIYGIDFYNVSGGAERPNIISNNKLYNLGAESSVYGLYNNNAINTWYYNNTVSMDGEGTASLSTALIRGASFKGDPAGSLFYNNIIVISRMGPGNKVCMEMEMPDAELTAARNDYYLVAGIGGRCNLGFLNNTYCAALPDWQRLSGRDALSFSVNPFFENLADGNLRPLNASIDNKGVYVAEVAKDIDEVNRNINTPDIGIYEYTPAPCSNSPVAGHAGTAKDTVCAGTAVMLTLDGYSNGAGQTYQWQSAVSLAGPFTNMGAVLTSPDTTIKPLQNLYYRVQVGCGVATAYSDAVLLVTKNSLAGGNYTLNQLAAPGAADFNSFTEAAAALACGIQAAVTIQVVPGSGVYHEQFLLDSIPGASANATVTVAGNGNTIRFGSYDTEERAVVKLDGTDFVTVDSLRVEVSSNGNYGYGVQLLNNADSNTFRRCVIAVPLDISLAEYCGVVIDAWHDEPFLEGASLCDGNLFTANIITGGFCSIILSGNEANPLRNNRFTYNTLYDFYMWGMLLQYTENTLVEHNLIARPVRSDVSTFIGIAANGKSNGLIINANKITNPFGGSTDNPGDAFGISLASVSADMGHENYITNNLFYNFNGGGTFNGVSNYGSVNTRCYHNTISFDNTANDKPFPAYGFSLNGTVTGVEVMNNIVTITRGGTGEKAGVLSYTDLTDCKIDYNDYYIKGAGGSNYPGYLYSGYTTLADWQAAAGQDAHSTEINPVFGAPANGNFIPAEMRMDNTGVNVQVTTDLAGVSRSAVTPDMGAFEFSLPKCTTPPVAGAASVSPASGICMGSKVELTLTGNSTGGTQTYLWQQSNTGNSGWIAAGESQLVKELTVQAMHSAYYRCAVACGTDTAYTAAVPFTLNAALPAGVYTIATDGTGDFPSFNAAVAAMECGIAGAVTFRAKAGTYAEQVRMHYVYGASDTSRITFEATGAASSVVLTHAATESVNNYVLQLDSAFYVTWKNIQLQSEGTDYGRVVEIKSTASYDSVLNCIIQAPVTANTLDDMAALIVNNPLGSYNVIKGNAIHNGAAGVYINGTYVTAAKTVVIDSNVIDGGCKYGIYTAYMHTPEINGNTVVMNRPQTDNAYGLFVYYADSSYHVTGNTITIDSSGSMNKYGASMTMCTATADKPSRFENNRIIGLKGNTGSLYGLAYENCSNGYVRNNIISIHATGNNAFGINNINTGNRYYNNSVLNKSMTVYQNYAAYFISYYNGYGYPSAYNNIFASTGGGSVLYASTASTVNSDYNLLYTTGPVLGNVGGAADDSTLQQWINASAQDRYSLVYKPAFTDEETLRPAVSDSTVWGMHGRGVQLADNATDYDNFPRPVTLQEGVPDLGAYEFVPLALPEPAQAIPALPAAGTRQVFMVGTDTVNAITWGNTIPATVTVRRYTGTVPPALSAGTKHMYFYTDVAMINGATIDYGLQQYYMDTWSGYIEDENSIGLGYYQGTAAKWQVDTASRLQPASDVIQSDSVRGPARYTGLIDSTVRAVPQLVADTSNMGKRFWVAYGENNYFGDDNQQQMVVYISTREAATVTVFVHGTGWKKQYHIPANTVFATEQMPKFGVDDARLMGEGKSVRAIGIESDVAVAAYVHTFAETNAAATLLLPVSTYGYEYRTLGAPQFYMSGNTHNYALFHVIADNDSTVVEITPSCVTAGGREAGKPFIVTLQKGEVYQVLGGGEAGSMYAKYDISGSKVRSVPNASGKCYPVAVFSGSSRTAFDCAGGNSGGGDNLLQQNTPVQSWGKKYLTAAIPAPFDATATIMTMYRVAVKDANTIVKRNGVPLDGLVNNSYYQFSSDSADYIEADGPVMVGQFMPADGGCSNYYDAGDPDMVYLSPLEQGVKEAGFFRTKQYNIVVNYVLVTIPDSGLPTLLVDGSNQFDSVYPHPHLPGYQVVVKRWDAGNARVTVTSAVAFAVSSYGMGYAESYGYNAGTLVKNLNSLPGFVNVYNTTGGNSQYTCIATPFRFNLLLPVKADAISWLLSRESALAPHADSLQTNPAILDSVNVNDRWYYRYSLAQDFAFTATGTYAIPVEYKSGDIESCDKTGKTTVVITVKDKPMVDFTVAYSGCLHDTAVFLGTATAANGVPVTQWRWNFDDNTGAYARDTMKHFAAPGIYHVTLRAIAADGCIADTTKQIEAMAYATVRFVEDTVAVCAASSAQLAIQNPETGIVYNWYDAATGGNLVTTGSSYTINSVTGTVNLYVTAVKNGCASPMESITALLLKSLDKPVVTADSVSPYVVRFIWKEVPGALGYEVSVDGGVTWQLPSSGSLGLYHLVTGLRPAQEISLMVKAKGGSACQDAQSEKIAVTTLSDQVFIPNAFTPNGDGLNDMLIVYSHIVKQMQFAIFNQWGEKVFETNLLSTGWDGNCKGKPQPSGVYMYVGRFTLTDGSVVTRKGSVNLVR